MAILGVGELGGLFSTARRAGDCSVCAGLGELQIRTIRPSQAKRTGTEIKNEPAIQLEFSMKDLAFLELTNFRRNARIWIVRQDPTVISTSASLGQVAAKIASGWELLLTKALSVADHCPTLG